jgi:hypothetical protein
VNTEHIEMEMMTEQSVVNFYLYGNRL